MKKFIYALIFAAVAVAGPVTVCPPVLTPDAQSVDFSCVGIGAAITAFPGSDWLFSFEDIDFFTDTPDADFNDFMGSLLVSPSGTSALVTFTGSNAGRWNTLLYGGVPLFATNLSAPGSTVTIPTTPNGDVPFVLKSSDLYLGDFYYGMGTIQDWAVCVNDKCHTEVPEPSYGVLGIMVMLASVRSPRLRTHTGRISK